MTSLNERKRKIVTSATNPSPSENAAIAICWPTEYAATVEAAAKVA